ncbi:hypothetical protein ES695_17915 [Candidatus Atribacteria bacterium 1244-E10-H5-B2]|nr:MAG: hypothetical protein ES695_17915 [Candidatus Atribacteria bacterium 1244-E10-H5-B2]
MKKSGSTDFGLDYFSPVGLDFQERENKIREKTKCFKTCSKCGEIKPIFKFSIEKRNTDGRLGICKECRNKESLEYYYQNRELILVKIKEYQKINKKDRSLYFKDYWRKHKKQLKENAKKWYKSNKKAIKKRNLKYYQENKEACLDRRKLWIIKNRERIRKYNREYNLKHRIAI